MNFTELKNFMDRLTAWRIPGNAISVWKDGEEVFSYQSGFADLENGIPMTGEEYLNIYSCSKVTTVTAALQLYEKGYFLLDDPLYEFIPEFREMYIRTPEGELRKAENPITLRHLFTMTSGMNYDCDSPAIRQARILTSGKMDTLPVIRAMAREPLSFEPGTSWQYSLSHDVLAAVVEVISGKKFRTYVREQIFDPLDMTRSMYHNEPVLEQMAQQYRFVDGSGQDPVKQQSAVRRDSDGYVENAGKQVSFVFGSEYDSGGAGITTTVGDYVKLVNALANGGMGHCGERILSAGTVELLKTNQLNAIQREQFNWSQLKGYGYGLGVRTLVDKAASGTTGSVGEFGWGGAAGATVLADTELKLAVFYAHHMLNPQEGYYQPRLRNVVYQAILG